MTSLFGAARQVADTVLYEGYVLYPYRASSRKNQSRWQFGVLMPPAYTVLDSSERSACQTEIVFEAKPDAVLQVQLRFLHLAHRTGGDLPEWDETIERQLEFSVPMLALRDSTHEEPFSFEGAVAVDGEVRRTTQPVTGAVTVTATELPGPIGALRLTARVENRTPAQAADRDSAMQHGLVATHTMFALERGQFLSMTDSPEWATPEIAACENIGTWPVLAGSASVVLSSPIILGDNPEIAPESPGDLYDATEIDEILTLRTMALTDAEKAEARATDPRAAAVIDQVDSLPQEHLDRLHGALRYLRTVTNDADVDAELPTYMTPDAPWWDPGADSSVSPDSDAIIIDGVSVSRGSRVRLRPGTRHTDAQDMFLHGKTATVEAVLFDVDGQQHLGVTLDDDEEMAEIARWQGRFRYFTPDEVEPTL